MIKLVATLSLCFFFFIAQAQTEEILTNQSVIDMVEMGFEPEVVIAKIKNSKTNFETSIDKLKELKDKGLAGDIIKAMLTASKPEEKVEVEKTGVFLLLRQNEEIKILPTAFSGSRTNVLAAGLTYGIASGKIKSTIHGNQSRNIVRSGNCSFMFYFKPDDIGNIRTPDWWFRCAASPNEFALMKLAVKKDSREIEVGSANVYTGTKSGVKNKNICPFTIEQIDDYTFKVTPSTPLEDGEYCFYYQGMIPQNDDRFKNQSVFDFSVVSQ